MLAIEYSLNLFHIQIQMAIMLGWACYNVNHWLPVDGKELIVRRCSMLKKIMSSLSNLLLNFVPWFRCNFLQQFHPHKDI